MFDVIKKPQMSVEQQFNSKLYEKKLLDDRIVC